MSKSRTLIASSVYGSDAFLGLSKDAQALYPRLNFECDGMGCVESSPMAACRMVGVSSDAYAELVGAGFVLVLEQGGERIPVLAHHWVNNKLDRKNFYPGRWGDLLAEKLVFVSAGNKQYALREAAPNGVSLDSVLPLSGTSLDAVSNSKEGKETERNRKEEGGQSGTRLGPDLRLTGRGQGDGDFQPRILSQEEAARFGAYPYGKSETIAQGCPSCSGHLTLTRIGEDGTEPHWLCTAKGHRFPFDRFPK